MSGQVYSTAEIFVSEGTTFSVSDLESEGAFLNEGNVYVTGDWAFSGEYSGAGSVELFSSEEQTFSHTSGDVFELYVQGGGDKEFFGNLAVSSYLSLEDGRFIVSEESELLLRKGASTGNSSQHSYVLGELKCEADDDLFFPVGYSEYYSPFELQEIETDAAVIGAKVGLVSDLSVTLDDRVQEIKSHLFLNISTDEELPYSAFALLSSYSSDCSGLAVGQADDLNDTMFTACAGSRSPSFSYNNCVVSSKYEVSGKVLCLIDEELGLFIPNALTPNATSPEDRVVKVYGGELSPEGFYFKVMNKWGDVLFETADMEYMTSVGWDGTDDSGTIQMAGQYYYKIEGRTISNEPLNTDGGAIWIIR